MLSLTGLWLTGPTSVQAADEANSHPHVLVCEIKGTRHFAYLTRIDADGQAVYMTQSGQAAIVPDGGAVTREGAISGSCSGKTLEELVADGQAYFILN
ncbi:MAG: hypothetical protein AAF637_05285 [Pseudomonadota bacterium]